MVHVGGIVVVDASGGGRATLTLADAMAHEARVKAFLHFSYRAATGGGFRRLPFAS